MCLSMPADVAEPCALYLDARSGTRAGYFGARARTAKTAFMGLPLGIKCLRPGRLALTYRYSCWMGANFDPLWPYQRICEETGHAVPSSDTLMSPEGASPPQAPWLGLRHSHEAHRKAHVCVLPP